MAIKISGTTVINDSRNIENIGIATATTFSGNITGVAATFTSNIIIGAGSAAAPSITPTGDSNTGIFFPTADTIAFAEGGAEALRIDSSGNLGIANTNPRGSIHVGADLQNGTTDAAAINLKQTAQTAAAGIYLERANERRGYSIFIGGDSDNLTFQRNNIGTKSNVMSLTRDGNVGIGTDSPTSKLDVVGDVRVVGVITATSDVKIGTKSVATTGKAIAMAMVFG